MSSRERMAECRAIGRPAASGGRSVGRVVDGATVSRPSAAAVKPGAPEWGWDHRRSLVRLPYWNVARIVRWRAAPENWHRFDRFLLAIHPSVRRPPYMSTSRSATVQRCLTLTPCGTKDSRTAPGSTWRPTEKSLHLADRQTDSYMDTDWWRLR